ncbi:hypothetical protein ACFQ2B_19295 [Streptomyces stramineus]
MATGADRAERIRVELRARPAGEPLWDALTHAFVSALADERAALEPAAVLRARLALSHAQLAAEQLRFEARLAATLASEIARRTGTEPERDLYPRLAATLAITTARLTFEHWVVPCDTPVLDAVREALGRVRVDP